MTTDERARLLLGISFACIPLMFLLTLGVGAIVIGFSMAGDDLDDLRSGASISIFILCGLLLLCVVTSTVCLLRGNRLEWEAMLERHERKRRELER